MKKSSILILMCTLVVTMSFNMLFTYAADDKNSNASNEQLIDKLFQQRVESLLNNDANKYDELSLELKKLGVEEISLYEVFDIVGDSSEIECINVQRSNPNIKYNRYESQYTISGVTYDVLRIVATPKNTNDSILYQSGSTTITNTKSATAKAMPFIKVIVSTGAGILSNTLDRVETVYSALHDIISGLSTSSTVTDIKSTYVWNAAETCTYIYIKKPNESTYKLSGRYSMVSSSTGINVPTLNLSNGYSITSIKQKNYTGSVTPQNYNNVGKAVTAYKNNTVDVSNVNKVSINGIENKTVKTIYLNNPSTPLDAGY